MGRPSNPKLMARVLDAITHLAEGKGSLTRDVLDFVKQSSSGSHRNLTMQVRRALKHAVNAGLLRCKSGRYKMQLAFKPTAHRRVEKNSHEKPDDINEEPIVGGADLLRRVQDRSKRPSRKKRAARKPRRRSTTRSSRRKVRKRRTATVERRTRKANKRANRRKRSVEIAEDWPTRRRRMMSKWRFDDDEVNDDDDEVEEEEEEEEEDDEEEGEEMPDVRNSQKMKGVNQDSASNVSGDSSSVGRHRSRRSKHLANDRKSPSRRGNGDTKGHRKSTRRSTSRRRSQQRQRENRQEFAPDEVADQREGMDEEANNEDAQLDDDQGDTERVSTPPKNPGNQ